MTRMVKADIEGTRENIEMARLRILTTRSLKTGNVVTTGQVGSFFTPILTISGIFINLKYLMMFKSFFGFVYTLIYCQ